MSEKDDDAGTITALLERFNHWQLPRAQALKAKMERGEALDAHELDFLASLLESAQEVLPIVERNPEVHQLAAQAFAFYAELVALAAERDESSS